jgi:SAM-dependent methyltransferase
LAWWIGVWQPADRVALRRIWDELVRDDPSFRVLFVGVRPYTLALTRSTKRAHVATIDRDRSMRLFGARDHRTIALESLPDRDSFDLIIVNGVLGAGIDTIEAANLALAASHRALRNNGVLVLGVNESRASMPDLSRVDALRACVPIAPLPFSAHRYEVPSFFEGSHSFFFYQAMRED